MTNEIIGALIALGGVIVSVCASLYTSVRITNTELKKVRTELQTTYTEKLLEKRLEHYPQLYFWLSDFMKELELGRIKKADIVKLLRETNKWNSKYAIFFSGRANYVSYPFRQYLHSLVTMADEEFETLANSGLVLELMSKVGEFEIALKNDIGVFLVEFPDTPAKFQTYHDVDTTLEDQTINT
jgi:hypothetical protein